MIIVEHEHMMEIVLDDSDVTFDGWEDYQPTVTHFKPATWEGTDMPTLPMRAVLC